MHVSVLLLAAVAASEPTSAPAPENARFEPQPYLSFDLAYAHLWGTYAWHGAPSAGATLSAIDAHVNGNGMLAEGAVGVTVQRSVSAGIEAAVAWIPGSPDALPWPGFGDTAYVRVGPRVEVRCKYPLFARAAFGAAWFGFSSRDNIYQPEGAGGPYGALTLGARLGHFGLLVRGEIARATSAHAVFRPATVSFGADVSWF